MDDPTDVEARFTGGRVTVLSFTWQGRRLPVTSHGRRWQAGESQHMLVMTPGDRTFELAYTPSTSQWRVVRAPEGPATA